MSRFPSRLSKQELLSYGFKEGQGWADDRRALESALREMDAHEREIQENYIYNRPVHSRDPGPWLPSPNTPRHYPGMSTDGLQGFPPQSPRYPANIVRMNRSDQSDSYSSNSESSLVAHRSRRANGYGHSRAYHNRDFPGSPGHASGQSGRPDGSYYPADNDAPAAAKFHRPSGSRRMTTSSQTTQNYAGQLVAPPLSLSTSSYYRNFHAMEESPKFSEAPLYYHSESAPHSPHTRSPTNAVFSPSGQKQLVRHEGDHGGPPQNDHPNADQYSLNPPPPTSPKAASPRWSVTTTHGTASENLSMDSSIGSHSEDSALSGYTDAASRSSGYVESYDVQSHEGPFYGGYRDHHDSEEADQDYMSDGVASDEGVYCSSSEGPEDDGDGEEVFSDEGYSSFSEDDGSYSDFE